MSKRFKVGDHVILEMSDGMPHKCIVKEFEWPSMWLEITDDTSFEPEYEYGAIVKIELEAVN